MGKIVIIGAGHVGSHCAHSLLLQQVCDEIALVDIDREKARCHALDLADAAAAIGSSVQVRQGSYADCDGADIVVISAGAPRSPGQSRTDVMRDTVAIMRDIIPKLAATRFGGVLIGISNPADVIAALFQQQLGLPPQRCLSTGTALDTARMRRVVARRLGVPSGAVRGHVLGEHGDSQVIAWSQVAVEGVPANFTAREKEAMEEETRRTGYDIYDGKGATEFGIGAVLSALAYCILHDKHSVHPVSVLLAGAYGQHGVYAGVPAVLGRTGVERIPPVALSPEESARFATSCDIVRQNTQAAMELFQA